MSARASARFWNACRWSMLGCEGGRVGEDLKAWRRRHLERVSLSHWKIRLTRAKHTALYPPVLPVPGGPLDGGGGGGAADEGGGGGGGAASLGGGGGEADVPGAEAVVAGGAAVPPCCCPAWLACA